MRNQDIYQMTKGRRFSEKDWYYLQAQTDMPFHYLKLECMKFSQAEKERTAANQ